MPICLESLEEVRRRGRLDTTPTLTVTQKFREVEEASERRALDDPPIDEPLCHIPHATSSRPSKLAQVCMGPVRTWCHVDFVSPTQIKQAVPRPRQRLHY